MKTEFLLDFRTILANQTQPVHLAIRFTADPLAQARPQPAAFCIVVDRSGSMANEPLAQAKAAAKLAVRNLRNQDLFALVMFDDEAQTVIPLQLPTKRDELLAAIEKIVARGSTNLTAGWMLGRDELRQAPPGTLRRLLLLSDGHLNQGIIEPLAVRQIVGAGLEMDQIRTSCLGFGDDYDEQLMAELSRVTNGTFYDAGKPENLPHIFAHELEGLQQITVQNLRLRLKPLQFCEGVTQLGEYPLITLPDGRVEISLGDLVSEEERISCFALEVLPLPMVKGVPVASLEGEQLLEVELLFDEITKEKIASRTLKQVLQIQATQDPAEVTLNGEVAAWVATQRAGRTMREVTDQLNQGKGEEVERIVDEAVAQLRAYSGDDQKIADALKALQELKAQWRRGITERELRSAHFSSSKMHRMSSREVMEYMRYHASLQNEPPTSPSPSPPPPPSPEPESPSPET